MFKEGRAWLPFDHIIAYRLEPVPNIPTVGITNQCTSPSDENMYVPFLDYDNIDYSVVRQDLDLLNKRFGLCSFVILTTSEQKLENQWGEVREVGNYLIIGFDKLSFLRHCQMQSITRCDVLHKKVALSYSARNWVVRIAAKYALENGQITELKPMPKVKTVLQFSESCNYRHCKAMFEFVNNYFLLPESAPINIKTKKLFTLKNLDRCRDIEIIEYSTTRK